VRKQRIILIGAGGHAVSCIGVLEDNDDYEIFGLIGNKNEVGNRILGYEVIGDDSQLGNLKKDCENVLIAVGQIRSPETRICLFDLVNKLEFQTPVVVSIFSKVFPHAKIAKGSLVMPGAIVMPGAVVEENCIINSNALIEHEVRIGKNCHISTGAIINGNTQIGENTFVGSGSILIEGLSIGSGSVIGAGLTIKRHILPNERVLK